VITVEKVDRLLTALAEFDAELVPGENGGIWSAIGELVSDLEGLRDRLPVGPQAG